MLNTQVGVSRYTGYTVFPAHERIHTEDTVEYSDRYTLHFALIYKVINLPTYERSYRKNIREANLANLVTSLHKKVRLDCGLGAICLRVRCAAAEPSCLASPCRPCSTQTRLARRGRRTSCHPRIRNTPRIQCFCSILEYTENILNI